MATINVSLPVDGETIDASDFGTPINTIVSEINGNLDNANIKTAAAIAGSKLADASIDIGSKASVWDGWIAVSDSWSYASATTITVPSDATTKYSVGDKIKLVQSATTKYFYVTAVSSTVLTVTGGTDYTVANSAISSIYYSKVETPQGFPQWFSFAPTYANITVGDGTVTAKFALHGKTCVGHYHLDVGSTTSIASVLTISLPITANSRYNNRYTNIGTASTHDSGTAVYAGWNFIDSSTTVMSPRWNDGAAATNNAFPFVEASGDDLDVSFTYEVA